ncbi:MAG: hypothetical protein WCL11_00030 [Verrucomicrobiota bacterium]
MKKWQLFLVSAWLGLVPGRAEITSTWWAGSFAGGGAIPDGTTAGWWDARTLTGFSQPILDVQLILQLSGGYNGDLYAHVQHGSGMSVLVNRVGVTDGEPFGYDDAGMEVTFSDSAAADIHYYRLAAAPTITGGAAWQPDGRAIDPLSGEAVFDSAGRQNMLSVFDGLSANGSWILFISDLSSGGETVVGGWGLQITTEAVPEPASLAMGAVLAVIGTAGFLVARRRSRSQ